MSALPIVSIVVPVYNTEAYLERCLDSLCGQTYSAIEIIIVNDGSTDGSAQIISKYAANDDRIKVVTKPNGGLAAARNSGVSVASGEWIWHVDSDDYVDCNSVEWILSHISGVKCDIAIFGHYRVVGEKVDVVTPRFENVISGEEALEKMLFHQIGGDVWCRFYKRQLYVEHNIRQDERYSVIEDVLLNYQLFSIAHSVVAVPCICVYHVYREGSYSSSAKSRSFLQLHHEGAVSMKLYGFVSRRIERAYSWFVVQDFFGILMLRDAVLLQMLGFNSVGRLYAYLGLLAKSDCSNKIPFGSVFLPLSKCAVSRWCLAVMLRIALIFYGKREA